MTVIYSDPVPENRRMDFINNLFGIDFPLRIEPTIYGIASRLSPDYGGGVWEFYALCNGGFYMAPRGVAQFKVTSENGFEGQLSADAFGLTVCLYAFSQLSFSKDDRFSELCASHFHRLRVFALDHKEAGAIFAAID